MKRERWIEQVEGSQCCDKDDSPRIGAKRRHDTCNATPGDQVKNEKTNTKKILENIGKIEKKRVQAE